MPDQLPPSRLQILERGGRLVVIDRLTGAPPPPAAERMKALDAARADAQKAERPGPPAITRPAHPKPAGPDAGARPATTKPTTKNAAIAKQAAARNAATVQKAATAASPWVKGSTPGASGSQPASQQAAISKNADHRHRLRTRGWWDKDAPRALQLSDAALQSMTGAFALFAAAIGLLALLLWAILPALGLMIPVMAVVIFVRALPIAGSHFVTNAVKQDENRKRL